MDHQQAIATHATERYLLNELSDSERDAFEDALLRLCRSAPRTSGRGPGWRKAFAPACSTQ